MTASWGGTRRRWRALADLAGVAAGQRALDVGCGPGALTARARRAGSGREAVAAVDPSESFVAAARERHPGRRRPARRRRASAVRRRRVRRRARPARRALHDRSGRGAARDGAGTPPAASSRPASGTTRAARARSRVLGRGAGVRPGGRGTSPISRARVRVTSPSCSTRPGCATIEEPSCVEVEHATFEEWWEPFTLGVGPAGATSRVSTRPAGATLRELAAAGFPPAPFTVTACAWAVRGRAG